MRALCAFWSKPFCFAVSSVQQVTLKGLGEVLYQKHEDVWNRNFAWSNFCPTVSDRNNFHVSNFLNMLYFFLLSFQTSSNAASTVAPPTEGELAVGTLFEGCHHDFCDIKLLCQNDGKCVAHQTSFSCDCAGTGFRGKFCEEGTFLVSRFFQNSSLLLYF